MTNMQKILAQGFFYNLYDDKCHIVHRTNEYVVFKRYKKGYNSWHFEAESMENFEIYTAYSSLFTAERKNLNTKV